MIKNHKDDIGEKLEVKCTNLNSEVIRHSANQGDESHLSLLLEHEEAAIERWEVSSERERLIEEKNEKEYHDSATFFLLTTMATCLGFFLPFFTSNASEA